MNVQFHYNRLLVLIATTFFLCLLLLRLLSPSNFVTPWFISVKDTSHNTFLGADSRLSNEFKSNHNLNNPNIVFILIDDLGFNDVSYHGSEISTPNLDQLAKGGIKLENYYVQPVCSPSRAQLMSGKYQFHTGLQHSYILTPQANCLPTDIPTLPDKLREAGYATHMVGKWHLGFYKQACLPMNRGFDTFYGILTGKGDHFTHNNSFTLNDTLISGYDFWDNDEPDWSANGTYSVFLYNKRVNRIIDEHDQSKPLFLYIPFQAVHSPLQVPDEYLTPYKHIKDENRQRYAGMTTCMDEAIGNIVNKLKSSGLWKNTVLVFSSDNGGATIYGGSNWPLRGNKTSLWEGGVRAVGFVHSELLPEKVRGTTSKQLMDISDWFPTLVHGVAGHDLDGVELDGYDMFAALWSSGASPRSELVHNIDTWPHNITEYSTDVRAAIRVGDWKLLTGDPASEKGTNEWVSIPDSGILPIPNPDPKGTKVWLFNVTADPCEKENLSSKYPEVVKQLVDKLIDYFKNGYVPPFYPDPTLDADPALHGGLWRPWV